MLRPLLKVQMLFPVRGRRKGFCTLPKVSKTWGFCSISKKTMAGVGYLKRSICKVAFRVAGAGGQGVDFLRGLAFWSIRSSGLLRWFCMTGAALRMTWQHFCVAGAALYTDGVKNRKTHWYEAVVFENCCASDVVKFKNWGILAE